MKKLFSLVGIFTFGALFLTGCGGSGNKLICTATEESDEGKYKAELTAELKDDKVDSLSAVLEFETEEQATQYGSLMKLAEAFLGEDQNLGLTTSGKKVTIKNMGPLMENSTDDDGNEVKIIGQTKDEFKKYAESQGYTCK